MLLDKKSKAPSPAKRIICFLKCPVTLLWSAGDDKLSASLTEPEADDVNNVSITSASGESSSVSEGRPIPFPYVLCRFPDDIQRLLDSADPALATDTTYRKKLRKALAEDVSKYTL
jgi:hypothetical protein